MAPRLLEAGATTSEPLLDTALFFTLAFALTGPPWLMWGIGDYGVKLAAAGVMLVPFQMLMGEHDDWKRLSSKANSPRPDG